VQRLPASRARGVLSFAASTEMSRPSRRTDSRLGFNSAARAYRPAASSVSSMIARRLALAHMLAPTTNRPRV
jgi:hypothetical protein